MHSFSRISRLALPPAILHIRVVPIWFVVRACCARLVSGGLLGPFSVLELGFLALLVLLRREKKCYYSEFLYIGNGFYFLSLVVLVLLPVVFLAPE